MSRTSNSSRLIVVTSLAASCLYCSESSTGQGASNAGAGGGSPQDVAVDAGGAATTSVCTGSPTPCAVLSSDQCGSAVGCLAGNACQGQATPCSQNQDQATCENEAQCLWNADADACLGVATSCDGFGDNTSCTSQPGCSWTAACSGTALDCSAFGADRCLNQPGCGLG
jgi:hypothetical protein